MAFSIEDEGTLHVSPLASWMQWIRVGDVDWHSELLVLDHTMLKQYMACFLREITDSQRPP